MHTFYAIQIYVKYGRMNSRKKCLRFLHVKLLSRNEIILPRFKTHSYDHSLFSEKALFLLAFHKKEKSWNQISSILVELMKLSVECVMQQLIE